jgi:hypothetical protein
MLILFCLSRLDERNKTNLMGIRKDLYVIVGDDLVLFNEDLYKEVQVVNQLLGVEFQIQKSKVPVGEDIFTEFCSRISINNVDASRIPPNTIRNASSN